MPYLDATVTTTEAVQVEFEAYCAYCNAGICGEIGTRTSRNRGIPQITVNPCPDCIKEKDAEIADLEAQIRALELELENAREDVAALEASHAD